MMLLSPPLFCHWSIPLMFYLLGNNNKLTKEKRRFTVFPEVALLNYWTLRKAVRLLRIFSVNSKSVNNFMRVWVEDMGFWASNR